MFIEERDFFERSVASYNPNVLELMLYFAAIYFLDFSYLTTWSTEIFWASWAEINESKMWPDFSGSFFNITFRQKI